MGALVNFRTPRTDWPAAECGVGTPGQAGLGVRVGSGAGRGSQGARSQAGTGHRHGDSGGGERRAPAPRPDPFPATRGRRAQSGSMVGPARGGGPEPQEGWRPNRPWRPWTTGSEGGGEGWECWHRLACEPCVWTSSPARCAHAHRPMHVLTCAHARSHAPTGSSCFHARVYTLCICVHPRRTVRCLGRGRPLARLPVSRCRTRDSHLQVSPSSGGSRGSRDPSPAGLSSAAGGSFPASLGESGSHVRV